MSDNSDLRGESFNVFGFFLKKTFRYEQREVGVLMARFLEHSIKRLLHLFPNGVAVWSNDHAALNGSVIGEFSGSNHIRIPSGVVFATLGHLYFGHNLAIIALCV